jgi:hypothetical protein
MTVQTDVLDSAPELQFRRWGRTVAPPSIYLVGKHFAAFADPSRRLNDK